MRIYTFEQDNISTTTEVDNDLSFTLYDLFKKSLIYNGNIVDSIYYVKNDNSCRIDTICNNIYGGTAYTEELLVTNNIINPFSIEDGDMLEYPDDPTKFGNMYTTDVVMNKSNKFNILKINKDKTADIKQLPPSINPGLNQIDVDYKKKKITVINKFK